MKIVYTLLFILLINLLPSGNWPAYLLSFFLLYSLITISRLEFGLVLKRSLVAIPFILSAVPVLFKAGEPLFSIPNPLGWDLHPTTTGFLHFLGIFLKSWLSIQMAVLFTATTSLQEMLTGFGQLRLPPTLITIFGLMWRYLFVISDEAVRLIRARASRSTQTATSKHTGGSIYWRAITSGKMAGSLLLRSYERSERVYSAMISRGFNGQNPTIVMSSLDAVDRQSLLYGLIALGIILLVGIVLRV